MKPRFAAASRRQREALLTRVAPGRATPGGAVHAPHLSRSSAPGTANTAASATMVGPVGICQNHEST